MSADKKGGTSTSEKHHEGKIHEIVLVPREDKNQKFSKFKNWCSSVLSDNDDQQDRVTEIAKSAIDSKINSLNRQGIENEKLESEIRFRHNQSKLLEEELDKKSIFIEYEQQLLEAKINKTNAETEAILTESRIKALQAFNELGIDATPVIEDGKFKGLFIEKK